MTMFRFEYTQMSAAISSDLRTISAAERFEWATSARAADEGVVAAGADAEDAVGRLDDVAGAGDEQRVLCVDDGDHGFERRSARSVRHSLASSVAARGMLAG